MRELKFRMYALDIQKMFEMDRLHLPCTAQPNPASVYMQYTGLKDKNGKEIYEGDIIRDWDDGYYYWVVKWNSEYGCFYIHEPHIWENFHSDDMIGVFAEGTVVGNIYENEELISQYRK
jgi:hypothetical protein